MMKIQAYMKEPNFIPKRFKIQVNAYISQQVSFPNLDAFVK